MNIDLTKEPLGTGKDGKPVFLKDIWPTQQEVAETIATARHGDDVQERLRRRLRGRRALAALDVPDGRPYAWDDGLARTCKHPPYFEGMTPKPAAGRPTSRARACSRCSATAITTDHISPAGSIKADGPAGKYLIAHGVDARGLQLATARAAATTR